MQHPQGTQDTGGNRGIPSLKADRHLINGTVLHGGHIGKGGVIQHILCGVVRAAYGKVIGGDHNYIGVHGQEGLVIDIGPGGTLQYITGVLAARGGDEGSLIHLLGGGAQDIAGAADIYNGLLLIGQVLGQLGHCRQLGVVVLDQRGRFLHAVGGGADESEHLHQLLMAFRQDQQGGNAHLGKGLGSVLLLHGQDNEIGVGIDAGFQVKSLGGADIGQVDKGGSRQLVNGALGGFILDADHLIGKSQCDAGRGGNVVAGNNALGLFLQGNFTTSHIRYGKRIGNGGSGIGSGLRIGSGGRLVAAGSKGSRHNDRQQ